MNKQIGILRFLYTMQMKVFKIYAILIVFMCAATAVMAQDKFDRLYRLPPDFSMTGHSVQQLEDGSYIMLSAIDTLDPADIDYTAARLTSFSDKGNENWMAVVSQIA